jgi:putative ABC transport system permease protein
MMWPFAWQNLITRPLRTTLAIVGLTIPLLAFLGLFSLSRGIRDLMGSSLSKMQDLQVIRQNSPSPIFSDLPADMAEKLRKLPGANIVAPEVWKIAPPIDGKGGIGAVAMSFITRRDNGLKAIDNLMVIEGQDLKEHFKLKNPVFSKALLPRDKGGGRFLTLDDVGKPNVVVSTKLARDFPNADGSPKRVGQKLKIGPMEFTIVGIFETGSFLLDITIVMDIEVARKLLGVGSESVSSYNIEATSVGDSEALAERIIKEFPGVTAQPISQFNLSVGAIMGRLDLFLLLAVALATLVGGVGIANTMLMSTMERYVEFGVMRTIGWTRRDILMLVTAESALLGLLSGAIGAAVACLLVVSVNRFLNGIALNMSISLVLTSLGVAVFIATLAGLYPAWLASRMSPMDAIRKSGTL